MSKWLYIVRGEGEDHRAFAARMRDDVAPRLLALDPIRLTLTVTEAPPPRLSLFPFGREPVAVFGVHAPSPEPFTEVLAATSAKLSAYAVDESHPVPLEQRWPDGAPTPSPVIVNLLHRRPGLSDAEYMRRWQEGHTALSLDVHPLWYYQRNTIREVLTPGSDPSDGVVLEAARDRAHLLNPVHFYGGPLRALPNLVRIGRDILGWLDMSRFEVFYATEYVLRRGPS